MRIAKIAWMVVTIIGPLANAQSVSHQASRAELDAKYRLAIQSAIEAQFIRPDNLPNVACTVHITQAPGGYVTRAIVDGSCPYDEAGKRALWGAVMRAVPLPYQGYEAIFAPTMDIQVVPR